VKEIKIPISSALVNKVYNDTYQLIDLNGMRMMQDSSMIVLGYSWLKFDIPGSGYPDNFSYKGILLLHLDPSGLILDSTIINREVYSHEGYSNKLIPVELEDGLFFTVYGYRQEQFLH
jgi:hypothetical protein